MDIKEYIESGILELYVYGALSQEENEEVSAVINQYPEIKKEVEAIEESLQNLAVATAPYNPEGLLAGIKSKLDGERSKVITLEREKPRKSGRIITYLSLAASLLFLIGIFALLGKNKELRDDLRQVQVERAQLESSVKESMLALEQTKEILSVYRDPEISKIPLSGQAVAPGAYANVFWDKKSDRAYIDAFGLPEPPEGMVYQVWSLKLDPLTPTSIGLLENFREDANKVFTLPNPNESQAFGITLEPAGGSATPNLDQLYTLGVVES